MMIDYDDYEYFDYYCDYVEEQKKNLVTAVVVDDIVVDAFAFLFVVAVAIAVAGADTSCCEYCE